MSFRGAFETMGWIEARNISLEIRWYGGEPRLANRYARELVDLAPDLILTSSTMGLEAVRSETRKIP
jgi:hypothetical protein